MGRNFEKSNDPHEIQFSNISHNENRERVKQKSENHSNFLNLFDDSFNIAFRQIFYFDE